ncbi:hypothetical protein PtA15_2A747 [Puccinia triticina]|uniref:Uncharacterized protein n=1 Tax=Puccinia triticina TaxID=208348 RepID=A0ABY7CF18_9BASI|nr:uncharacterized protein PtA15_2A747 [Puccinia triticina]WAQ82430.1 hypothetical protein PtA15_2A747 [Puccinia triticina]
MDEENSQRFRVAYEEDVQYPQSSPKQKNDQTSNQKINTDWSYASLIISIYSLDNTN